MIFLDILRQLKEIAAFAVLDTLADAAHAASDWLDDRAGEAELKLKAREPDAYAARTRAADL